MSGSTRPTDSAAETREATHVDRTIREARVTFGESAFDAMGIGALVGLLTGAGLRQFEALSCHDSGAVAGVELERPPDEERLASLDCTDWWARVSASRTAHLYVVAFTAPAFPASVAARADGLIGTCDPDVTERGVAVTLVGAQQAIADVVDRCRDAGLSPELRRLGPYDGGDRPLDALTDRQREVLWTAHELGYYDVPRDVTAEAIADELGIDSSTAAEHLQRAERNVLSRQLPEPR